MLALRRGNLPASALLGVAMLATLNPAAHGFEVERIGSFHIGGQPVRLEGVKPREIPGSPPTVIDPNGDFHTGQMYVQYVKLARPRARVPLLLWHTGGVTGASFETKPDGTPGWMQYFLQQGFDVFVSDAVERGRATFSRHPEIYKSEPIFRDKKEAWEIFRIGPPGSYSSNPAMRDAHPGQKFPVAAFDALQMQLAPRWASNGEATQAAYNQLVQRVCPCAIIAHGQAGSFAMNAALANPEKVAAVVTVESAFAPKPDHPGIQQLKQVPHLHVWGDFLGTHPVWVEHVAEIRAYHEALKSKGVVSEWLDLPGAGIKGNSHMIMMDTNSDAIAAKVTAWLEARGIGGEEKPRTATPGTRKPERKSDVQKKRQSQGT
jgi:hypothetical protein